MPENRISEIIDERTGIMANWPTYSGTSEQDLRTEMFSVHPEIMGEAAPLPRRVDGTPYALEGGNTEPGDGTPAGGGA
jgi:hypothetical protein